MKRKKVVRDDEVVTRGILKHELTKEFKNFKVELSKEFATKEELRNGLHELEFKLVNRMDNGFGEIRQAMKKQTDIFQQLADKVIVEHQNFEVESLSLRHNYHHLKERVKTVEEVVFPGN